MFTILNLVVLPTISLASTDSLANRTSSIYRNLRSNDATLDLDNTNSLSCYKYTVFMRSITDLKQDKEVVYFSPSGSIILLASPVTSNKIISSPRVHSN